MRCLIKIVDIVVSMSDDNAVETASYVNIFSQDRSDLAFNSISNYSIAAFCWNRNAKSIVSKVVFTKVQFNS